MTPKEKAIELIGKFTEPTEEWVDDDSAYGWVPNIENAKACALICIDEIIATNPQPWIWNGVEGETNYLLYPDLTHVDSLLYWGVVKEELNSL